MSRTSRSLAVILVLGLLSQVGCSFGEIYLDDELLCGPSKPQAKMGADR